MARQVLPIVGAVVGSFIPGVGTQIGFMIGSVIGNAVDPQVIKGPSIGDGVQQTSKEGVPRPIVYGRACVAGNLIDRSPIRKWKQRNRGSKGGPVHEEERMSMTFAIRICEGPIGGLLRIWEDEKLVYDARPESAIPEESARYAERFRFYRGTEDQLPDPALEAIREPGETPSYRGTAYIVFDDLDVTDRRGSVPNFRFEVVQAEGVEPAGDFLIAGPSQTFKIDQETMQTVAAGTVNPPYVSKDPNRYNRANDFKTSKDGKTLVAVNNNFDGTVTNFLAWERIGDSYHSVPVLDPIPGNKPIGVSIHPDDSTLVAVLSYDGFSGEFFMSSYRRGPGGFSLHDSADLGIEPFPSIHVVGDCQFNCDGTSVFFYKKGYDTEHLNPRGMTYIGRVDILNHGDLNFNPLTVRSFGSGYRDEDRRTRSPVLRESPTSGSTFSVFHNRTITVGELDLYHSPENSPVFIAGEFVGNTTESGHAWAPDGLGVYYATGVAGVGYVSRFYEVGYSEEGVPYVGEMKLVSPLGSYLPIWLSARGETVKTEDGFVVFFFHFSDSSSEQGRMVGYGFKNEDNLTATLIAQSPVGQGAVFPVTASTVQEEGGSVTTLGQVLTDLAERVKFNPSLLNLEEVGDTAVRGFVVAGTYEGQNVIRSLQDSFLFDPAEWDGRVHFVPRGKDVVTVIDEEDLVEEPVDELRESAREYPQRLELFYQNPDIDYAAAKAVAERLSDDYDLSGAKVVEVPVTMTVDEAWQVADMQLKVAWEEAKGQITLSLPSSFDFLTPTDCIGFYRRGIGNRLRITQITKQDGVLTVKAHYDRQSAYTSDVTGLPVIPPTPPPSTIAGPTLFQFLNIPALVDQLDPVLHYYYGATGRSDAWNGAAIQRRVGDDDFDEVSRVQTTTRMGELEEPLAYASEHYPDTTNSILVRMYRDDDDLESVSDNQLLREQNAVAIARPDGTAELLQFRDVEDLGDRLFRLSYLIRGRLNSGASSHEAGAVLVVLDDVAAVAADPVISGAQLEHRPVSFGESPETAQVYEDLWAPPLSQVEWPVAELHAERQGDQILVQWSPRERFGTDVNPIRSVNWQAYRVHATDGANSITTETLQPSVSLDASQFSGPVTVAVSQVNRYTGEGPSVQTQVQEQE